MKTLLIAAALMVTAVSNAQTATNFTCNDCQGNPHDLFTELDTGCVVVIDWVMPCATCVGPSLTAYNIVQSYATSHPGRVKFYMVDDYANTTCTSLTNWANSNNMPGTTTFSNSSIDMLDYGTAGMPKIVVLGGLTHTVYYNSNGTGNATQLQNAIDSALAETGVQENSAEFNTLTAWSDVAGQKLTLNFSAVRPGNALIDIYSPDGKQVRASESHAVISGTNLVEVNTAGLPAGVYIMNVTLADRVLRTRVIIQ